MTYAGAKYETAEELVVGTLEKLGKLAKADALNAKNETPAFLSRSGNLRSPPVLESLSDASTGLGTPPPAASGLNKRKRGRLTQKEMRALRAPSAPEPAAGMDGASVGAGPKRQKNDFSQRNNQQSNQRGNNDVWHDANSGGDAANNSSWFVQNPKGSSNTKKFQFDYPGNPNKIRAQNPNVEKDTSDRQKGALFYRSLWQVARDGRLLLPEQVETALSDGRFSFKNRGRPCGIYMSFHADGSRNRSSCQFPHALRSGDKDVVWARREDVAENIQGFLDAHAVKKRLELRCRIPDGLRDSMVEGGPVGVGR